MFNILTVIISVALTAVMGAAGVFYVGSAFTTAGPKAAAVGIIQALSQVDAAWTLYGSNGNTTTLGAAGSTFPTMSGAATQTDLINTGYLAAVPTAPTISSTWNGVAGAYTLDLTNTATATGVTQFTSFANGGIFLVLGTTALSQCTEIARAGGQISSTGTLAAPGTGLTLGLMLSGIALLGVVTANIAAWFIARFERDDAEERRQTQALETLTKEVRALRTEVAALAEARRRVADGQP